MQFTITRQELPNGRFKWEGVVDFTVEERRNVARYGLQNYAIYSSITVGELELGLRGEFGTLAELLTKETEFRYACNALSRSFDAMGKLDGSKDILDERSHPAPTPTDTTTAGECPEWLIPLLDPFAPRTMVTVFLLFGMLTAALNILSVTVVAPDVRPFIAILFVALPIGIGIWAKIDRSI